MPHLHRLGLPKRTDQRHQIYGGRSCRCEEGLAFFGNNFVKTIFHLARECDQLRIVDDQIGCPISTLNIAESLLSLLGQQPDGRRGRQSRLLRPNLLIWCRPRDHVRGRRPRSADHACRGRSDLSLSKAPKRSCNSRLDRKTQGLF
ncbi:MAG: sugar nucleotide-binding protein [Candidatus Binatia bacterium]